MKANTPWAGAAVFRVAKQPLAPRFVGTPYVWKIPAEGESKSSEPRVRVFKNNSKSSRDCPKPSPEDLECAVQIANELEQMVKAILRGGTPKCEFECSPKTGSSHASSVLPSYHVLLG